MADPTDRRTLGERVLSDRGTFMIARASVDMYARSRRVSREEAEADLRTMLPQAREHGTNARGYNLYRYRVRANNIDLSLRLSPEGVVELLQVRTAPKHGASSPRAGVVRDSRTLSQRGPIYVSLAATQQYADHRGLMSEQARRELTTALLDATCVREGDGARPDATYRVTSAPGVEITAIVAREGRLLVVVALRLRDVDPAPRPR